MGIPCSWCAVTKANNFDADANNEDTMENPPRKLKYGFGVAQYDRGACIGNNNAFFSVGCPPILNKVSIYLNEIAYV